MTALDDLGFPPARDCAPEEQTPYVLAVADALAPIVRRIDTPGFRATFAWPTSFEGRYQEPGSIEVSVFYCLGCASLHRRYALFDPDDQLVGFKDIDAEGSQ